MLDATGPVYEEFPEAVHDDSSEVLACTLPPRHPDASGDRRSARAATRVRPRSDVVWEPRRDGRVVDADRVPGAIEALVRIAGGVLWKEAGLPGIPARVAQDVRGYYQTAVLGLTDHVPSAWTGTLWFFDQTETGRVLLAARAAMRDADVKQAIWFSMTPGDH